MERKLGRLIGSVTFRQERTAPQAETNGTHPHQSAEQTGHVTRPAAEQSGTTVAPVERVLYFDQSTDLAAQERRAIRGQALRRATGR